jgi:hypothetical protein
VLKYKFFKAVRWLVSRLIVEGAIFALVFGAYFWGQFDAAREVSALNVIVAAPEEKEAPVLVRIMDCESGARKENGLAVPGSKSHYDKNGQVLMRANVDGTIDIGIGQINEYHWGAKATELGLQLTVEADNVAIAEWIYQNVGTSPWEASRNVGCNMERIFSGWRS